MQSRIQQLFQNWALRRLDGSNIVTLTQRRIYILPTRQGLAFACILALMLLGDINYNLSLGYALTFLLATAAALTMLHAFRNLAQLEIRAGRNTPVFAGEQALFVFHFHNPATYARHQLALHDAEQHRVVFDLPPAQNSTVQLAVPATRRGWLHCGKLTLYTEFPLGLFHAWSYLHFDAQCLVYPMPSRPHPLPENSLQTRPGKPFGSGDDDFAGLRNYVAGDALPRIAWKSLARGHELQVKQFSAMQSADLWLDWFALPAAGIEQKLSMLTRWVLDAEAAHLRYGLRLPHTELAAGSGTQQMETCLLALALYGLQD